MHELLHYGQDRSRNTLQSLCQLPVLPIGLNEQYLVLRRPGQDFPNHYLEGCALSTWRLRGDHLPYCNVDEIRSARAWINLFFGRWDSRVSEHNLRRLNRALDSLRQWHYYRPWETHKRGYNRLIFVFGSRQKHRDGGMYLKCLNLHYWARPFHTTRAAWQHAAQKTTNYHWLARWSAHCRAHPRLHSKQTRDQDA